MTDKAPRDDLALERVMPHHRAAWRAERISWALGALLLVLATLGLFGYGPVSRTTAGTRGVLEIEYDRWQRSSAPSDYEITAGAAHESALRLRFDQALIENVEIDDIVPAPEHVIAGTGYTEFVFNKAAGEPGVARIVFWFRPTTFGHRRGHITAAGSPPVLLDQYTYP